MDKLDLEDLIPFNTLRISALTSAAKISKDVTNVTIGPNSVPITDENLNNSNILDTSQQDENGNDTSIENDKKNASISNSNKKKSRCLFSETPEIDVYDSEPPSPQPLNMTLADLKLVSQKFHQKNVVQKELEKEIRKENAERAERMRAADKLRYEKFLEATRVAEKSLVERMAESEKLFLDAVAEAEEEFEEFEAEQQQKLKEMKYREKDLKERSRALSKFRVIHASFKKTIEEFMKIYTEMDKDQQNKYVEFKKTALIIIRAFETVVRDITPKGPLNVEAIDNAKMYLRDMESLKGDMCRHMFILRHELNTREIEEKKRKEEREAKKQQQQEQQLQQQAKEAEAAAALASMTNTTNVTQDAVDNRPNQQGSQHALSQFVSEESLQRYEAIMSVYRRSSEEVKRLSEDPRTKEFRMNCQKAVNTPINAISANSPEFLLDKYRKLEALLREEVVAVGNNQVTVNAHPLGKLYVTLLISRKFINQSDTIMTSAAKAEFPIAAVIVALWQKFPTIGEYFLAYLYKDCPFFVPYFLPQIQGQSNEDYMKSLGYRYTNGVLEKHDLYLKRMCGIARLYAAIWIASPRRGETAPHPHNLHHGWKWLCEILNLDPLPEICATLLFEVLQVAGNAFLQVYGRQFIKLLMAIQTQYFPKLNLVDKGGPKARLEGFVTKILQERKIDAPEGILPPNYW